MTDYGHELEFGTFFMPTATQADNLIALSRLAEEVGLDMVTVQDHPYQPAFLDAWTLLSVIAARTQRIKVTTNVANLPLRPPFVLAKLVASLDILTHGRVELGIGAGGFMEPVVAAGGPSLTAGESVEALEEGIGIIRQVWDAPRRGIQFDGKHYHIAGARPGPAPAHDIGIWVGAIKPRMLRLTGRLGDGWSISSPYYPPAQLAEPNAVLDQAAIMAGRQPADIRRMYNLAPGPGFRPSTTEEWVEQLASIALEHGMSVFILPSDDPDDLRRFGKIAARVREVVADARAERGGR